MKVLKLSNDSMIRTCLRKDVDFRPVWFMRQAGRYLPSYQRIRKKYDVVTIAKTPKLASEVTVNAARDLGVDAAVIFADIMLPLEPMGVRYHVEENVGPIIHNPMNSEEDVDELSTINPEEDLRFVMDAIQLTVEALDDQIPLIGFAGAPFTLASYIVEGRPSRDFLRTKEFMFKNSRGWHKLMNKLAVVMADYLKSQVKAGARILQLFDSWVGCLSPSDYDEFVLPYSKRIFEGIRSLGVPSIHFATNTSSSLLEMMATAGSDVIGVDWRVQIDKAWQQIGEEGFGIQGNLEPAVLLADGDVIRRKTSDILKRTEGKKGHIFNLGHGVLPNTPVDGLLSVVKMVHETKIRN
jgi:uroporphyrinogen decarboxylase